MNDNNDSKTIVKIVKQIVGSLKRSIRLMNFSKIDKIKKRRHKLPL